MKLAQFTDPQILDASAPGGLNPAFGLVSGAFASMGSGTWAGPGLSAPEAMTVSFSGMVATVGLPAPWGVVSSGGVIVRAHGTQTGMDTQTYSVNLAPLVPVSGSLTAYLAATVSTIQQGPFPVPGPPPGHPAYDPNYVPSVAYAATVYTVALAAVSGGIDNVNTFELLRTTLSAGQGAVTGWSTAGQARAADRDAWPATVLPSGGLLSPGEAQYMLLPATSGLTHTLPPASGAGGLMFGGVNPTAGPWTLAATGSDLIAGLGASGGASSLAVPPSGAALLWANAASGIWQLLASSPNMVPQEWTAGNVSSVSGATVSGGVLTVAPQEWTAGNVSSVSGAVVSGTTLIAAPLAGSASQTFNVANAVTATEAVALGQLNAPMQATSGRAYGSNTSLTVSVSFTAPSAGILFAIGNRNNSSEQTSGGNTTTLYINGIAVDTDTTDLSTTHFGSTILAAGGVVSALYAASAVPAFSINVILIFIPNV